MAFIRLKLLFLKNSKPTSQQSRAASSAVNNEQDVLFSVIVGIASNNPASRGSTWLDHTMNGQNIKKSWHRSKNNQLGGGCGWGDLVKVPADWVVGLHKT